MATSTVPPAERLLSTLDALSLGSSVLDVGINALLSEARVAKASLYQHFGSKEALLCAWLQRRQEQWFAWLEEHLRSQAATTPRAQIEAAFGFLVAWTGRDDFAGCPFLDVALHVKGSDDPVAEHARLYHDRLRAFFDERLAEQLGVDEGGDLLVSLYLGGVAQAQLGVPATPRTVATALSLVDGWVSTGKGQGG